MSVTEAKSMALYDLLARHWDLGAPVEQLAFDAGDGALAFALADGRAAIAAVADTEPPQARFRVAVDTGRATLSRRRHAVPPIPQRMLDGAPLRIAAAGASGFLAGGRSGQITCVMKGCVTEPFALRTGPLEAMIPMPNAAVLVASEGLLTAYETQGGAASARPMLRYEGRLIACAVAPDGRSIAISDARGLSVRSSAEGAPALATLDVGALSALSWSPDGRWLSVGLVEGGVLLFHVESGETLRIPNYPASVSSISWSADACHLVTSGAYRIIVWSMAALSGAQDRLENVETGCAGLVPVTAVGLHPREPRVAAGFANGLVVLARIGSRDELAVKAPGHGAVRALGWSHDGEHVAFGTDSGHAAIVTFPPQLFK